MDLKTLPTETLLALSETFEDAELIKQIDAEIERRILNWEYTTV